MEAKKYILHKSPGVHLSGESVDKLLTLADADAALLYIFLADREGQLDPAEGQKLLGSEARLKSALGALKTAGLIGTEAAAVKAPPLKKERNAEYSAEDLARELKRGDFKILVGETQRKLGKVLSSSDLNMLLGIYDYLALPAEVISLLLAHCIETAKSRRGESAMPTMRQIEKEAYFWSENGIDTVERATEHLRKMTNYRSKVNEVGRALQITGRVLANPEKNYIKNWLDMGFDIGEIEYAYEKTILSTGGLKWGYLNAIIKKWGESGLFTLKDIRESESRHMRGSGRQKDEGVVCVSADSYEKGAIELMRRLRNK